MKSFTQFNEDAGQKFRKMTDAQFADWKSANPGAADKADRLRNGGGGFGAGKSEPKTTTTSPPPPKKPAPKQTVDTEKSNDFQTRTKPNYDNDPLEKASGLKYDPNSSTGIAKSSALAKVEPKALPPADKGGAIEKPKPDLRKSQLGKWSQGVKQSPGALAKKAKTGITKPDIKGVKVKDITEPKKTPTKPAPGNTSTPVPDASYSSLKPKDNEVKAKKKKKSKVLKNIGKRLNGLRKMAMDSSKGPDVDTYGETQQGGLSGRNKGVGN